MAQARLQERERRTGAPCHELLLAEQRGRGLARLPEPSPGDGYPDVEGDPYAAEGAGRGHLAGLWDRSGTYPAFWAHDAAGERVLTEQLLDELTRRWSADAGMHVSHDAPDERAALAKLTAGHATRELEWDQLLRAERLVDRYAVARQGLRVSSSPYSITKLEAFSWGRSALGQFRG